MMYLAYSFEEIMAYHPDNKDVYSEIKENLSNLVPFVGAGLTQFAYPSWNQALTELADKITNKTDSKQVKKLIRDGHYMDAAQQLENLRTPSNLARDIAHLFSSDHLTNKIGKLPKEAISLLPWLFEGLVLTTNFDETLETVYRECGCPFQTVSHPGHQVLEQFIRNQNQCGLFKMHGTVTGNFIEYENIVFTSAQYDRHYGKDSQLIHDLKACFGKRLMFFLGCSLEKDRTMDILQDTIIKGVNHYAVIGCNKSERDEKIRKLGEKYIRVILYEQGRHEAVRVILEHLLEETKPDIYQKIRPVGALKLSVPSDRFSYDAGIVPLSGRKKELEELNSFLQTPGMPFQWWAITGPGGCGKSRLAYEFQNHLPPGWLARYLKQSDYKNLHGMTANLTQKTLLIADYVQEHARELGEWMESLNCQPRSLPIRILLVEREADSGPENSAWTKQLYSDVNNEIKLKETCYQKNFLSLSPLSDQDLLDIMENYAAALQVNKWKTVKVLTDKNKQMLLQKLKAVDPDLCRPLYAMFLADAYVESNDIERWKREDILDYVISREKKRLQFSIRNVMHTDIIDQNLYNACVYLQCAATALQDVPVENLPELFPDIWKIIENRSEYFESPVDFLYQIGIVVNGEIPALRPDLIGEYFVYDWLFRNSEKKIQNFIFAIWKASVSTGIFFQRLLTDFHNSLNTFPERWNILFPDNIHLSKNALIVYVLLVVTATFYCNRVIQCEKLVYLLEKLVAKYPHDLEIVSGFASGLVNLSREQNRHDTERTVARLEKLYDKYTNANKITVAFAAGLVILTSKQDLKDAEKTVTRLENFYDELPDLAEIVAAFSTSLVFLISKQDLKDVEGTIARLEKLYDKHTDSKKITDDYANGLALLITKQDLKDAERTIARLEKLYNEHMDSAIITADYANGLVLLITRQDLKDAESTIVRLEKLYNKHTDSGEIAANFANGLVFLSIEHDWKDVERTVARLEELYDKHTDSGEIAVDFAKSLFILSRKQDKQNAKRTIACLEKLYNEHTDMVEITFEFAKGLFILSRKQSDHDAERTVARLEKLYDELQDLAKITIEFTEVLFIPNRKQSDHDAERIVARLEKLYDKRPDLIEITYQFEKVLFDLNIEQDSHDAERIVSCLEKLCNKQTDSIKIVTTFVSYLVYLSHKQDTDVI